MSETDYVVRELKLVQKAIIDALELYKTIKSWFKNRGYNLLEKEYENIKKELASTKIKFDARRKFDDYTEGVIRITLEVKDYEESGRAVKGQLESKFESFLSLDYEDRYEKRPLAKFFRAVWDKITARDKFTMYEEELRTDTYGIYNEIKAFLNLHKLK